jgi:dimethylglycine dehydrogenase
MAGIELPVSPMKHHYLISDTIPKLEEIDFEVPMTVDLEGFTYLRQDQKGVLLGIYEVNTEHWAMDGAPWDYGMELFQEQTDRIEHELTLGFERYPDLQTCGRQDLGQRRLHLLARRQPAGRAGAGQARLLVGLRGDGGLPAGRRRGQDAGRMDDPRRARGRRLGMDVARYGDWAENREYIRQTTGQFYSRRFVMTYPNEQLPAGRPLKMAPAYSAMTEAGCQWGQSWDLEVPLYFGGKGFEETPSLKRSNAHDVVGAECRAVREAWAFSISRASPASRSRAERGGVAEPASWLHDAAETGPRAAGRGAGT